MEKIAITYLKTPLRTAKICGNSEGIISISFSDDIPPNNIDIPSCLKDCVTQLKEYFEGNRKVFDLKLNPSGTDFQKRVWKSLLEIPSGKTKSYLEQSKILGDPKAIRAVASANGKNPMSIVIPCHRIIGSDGSLTGYASGLWRKKWLLNHETENKQQSLF